MRLEVIMKAEIKVGIADYKISKAPDKIITLGLGSCVGIAIYDKYTGIGGLSHIMLPDSQQFQKVAKVEKFADLAIPHMVKELLKSGINKRGMVAKIAGGASMFQFADKSPTLDIGARNIKAVKKTLKEIGIPILAEDVGGNSGRTMILDLENLSVHIKTVGKEVTLL